MAIQYTVPLKVDNFSITVKLAGPKVVVIRFTVYWIQTNLQQNSNVKMQHSNFYTSTDS